MAIKGGIYRGNFYDKNGFGNYVSVQHDDGIRTIYGHLESINKDLVKGQRIEEGQILGIEGNTGFSTGTHLHLEATTKQAWACENFVNPLEPLGIPNVRGTIVKYSEEPTPPPILTIKRKKFPWQIFTRKIRNRRNNF